MKLSSPMDFGQSLLDAGLGPSMLCALSSLPFLRNV